MTVNQDDAISLVRNRVAVAFDVATGEAALELREVLGPCLGLAKVGSALFVREGMTLVEELKRSGVAVFLDLKFHDIPSVVGQAVEKAAAHGVDYLTVHASGGTAMMEAAAEAAERCSPAGSRTKVLAVTVLTSLDLPAWQAGASPKETNIETAVRRLAGLAMRSGAHGLVGSVHEASLLREAGGAEAIVVTPGIRVPGVETADQSRGATVEEAVASGADILVVGRGITRAPSPEGALRSILTQLAEASVTTRSSGVRSTSPASSTRRA
jgi:orotidine-5'-phosphate decarboxylase